MAKVIEYELKLPYYPSILIYGASDAGKTVLASCSPDLDPKETVVVPDVLFFDAEGGMISHITRGAGIIVERYPKDTEKLTNSKEALGAGIDYLKANKDRFHYAVLDSLDRYQECAIDNIIRAKSHERAEIQDWGDVLTMLQRLGRSVPTWGVTVVFTCHSEEAIDQNDRVMKRMPLIQGKFRGKLESYFDLVGYYERVVEDSGEVKRILYTQGTRRFKARSRLGVCLPDMIVNPTIPSIINEYRNRRADVIKQLKANPNIKVKIIGEDI
ncbi:MAG: ATP-binding protein [Nanoarchaeota archaeon]|nr:ATP-binding protein [Nanoarchaeota archaeon]